MTRTGSVVVVTVSNLWCHPTNVIAASLDRRGPYSLQEEGSCTGTVHWKGTRLGLRAFVSDLCVCYVFDLQNPGVSLRKDWEVARPTLCALRPHLSQIDRDGLGMW